MKGTHRRPSISLTLFLLLLTLVAFTYFMYAIGSEDWKEAENNNVNRKNSFSNSIGKSPNHEIYLKLMDVFIKLTRSLKLPWMLYGHSLLRSWFHHGMYFDQSLEVIMDIRDRRRIEQGLDEFIKSNNEYRLDKEMIGMKLSKSNLHQRDNVSVPFLDLKFVTLPFLDLKFFTYNATHTWELSTNTKIPSKFVFPIVDRLFEQRIVLAPQDTYEFLLAVFGDGFDLCRTKFPITLNHSESLMINCSKLTEMVPFVHRTKSSRGGIIENLKLGNVSLSTWRTRDLPYTGLNNTFSLKRDSKNKLIASPRHLNPFVEFETRLNVTRR